MKSQPDQLIATCTHCGTGWALDDDKPTCPGCGATSYTVPLDDVMYRDASDEEQHA